MAVTNTLDPVRLVGGDGPGGAQRYRQEAEELRRRLGGPAGLLGAGGGGAASAGAAPAPGAGGWGVECFSFMLSLFG